MLKKQIVPCMNCDKRSFDCHVKCKDYIRWKEAYNKENNIIKKNKKGFCEYTSYWKQHNGNKNHI